MRTLAAALALAACAQSPAPQSAVEAFAPLMGCWRGTFENQPDIRDERCFEPLGDHVVDTHAVLPTAYAGETTYHLDETAGEIVFAYAANDGGRSNGVVRREGDRFVIEPHTHVGGGGEEYRLRSTWSIEGADRFVMRTERQVDGAWRPFSQISFVRVDDRQ